LTLYLLLYLTIFDAANHRVKYPLLASMQATRRRSSVSSCCVAHALGTYRESNSQIARLNFEAHRTGDKHVAKHYPWSRNRAIGNSKHYRGQYQITKAKRNSRQQCLLTMDNRPNTLQIGNATDRNPRPGTVTRTQDHGFWEWLADIPNGCRQGQ